MKVIRSSLFTLSLLALSNCGGQTAFDFRAEGDASAGSRPLSVLDDAGAGDDTPGPARDSSVVDDGDDETADDETADDETADDETDDSVADDDDSIEDDLPSDDTDETADESSLDDDDDSIEDDSSEDDLVTDESSDDLADDLVLDDIDDLVADEGVTDDVDDEALDDLVTDDDDSIEDDSATDDDATDDSDDDDSIEDDSATDDDATDDDTDPTPTSTGTGTTPTSTSTGTTPTSTSTGTTPTTTSTSTQPPPPEELPEECDPPSVYNQRDNCYLQATCEDEYLWANCYNNNGDWECYCQNSGDDGYHSLEVNLTNLGSINACTFAANLCSTKTTIEFPEEEVCGAPSESVYDESCNNYTTCTRSLEFQGGVEAVLRRTKTTNCYSGGDDVWGCSCYDNGSSLDFEMTSTAEPRNVCKSAASICETGITIDPQAPIECEQTSGYGDRNNRYCSAELTCAQSATVSDASITLFGSVWTDCSRGTGNTWACSCRSGSDSAEYEFTSSSEAFAACSEAAAYCEEQDLVEIQVSSGGGFPVPL